MLKSLEIENIAVIEKVSIEFGDGFNALTGETGAGKSIIIDSLNAVLGLRTSRDLVRTGASKALVIAVFSDVSSEVIKYLDDIDIDLSCDDLILQRRIEAEGKSSCRINGKPVTAAVMKGLGELLINVHGQHDSQKLLDEDRHYLYIDEIMDKPDLIAEYRTAYSHLVEIMRELKALNVSEEEKQKELSRLEYEIDEIEKADIKPGEKEELLKQKKLLDSLENIYEALSFAKMNISGDDETSGALSLINGAYAKISANNNEELADINKILAQAAESVNTAEEAIREKLYNLDMSPEKLNEVEERLSVYYDFSNRYGKTDAEILDYLETAKKQLKDIKFADKRRKELESEFETAKENTYNLALRLSDERKKTAREFEKRVESELAFLDMPNAKFEVGFTSGAITKRGIDEIKFLISVNAGESLKPLASVASGGELSRIMLAFRAVLGEKESVPTLIFDEIDSGVSGRAAQKVGLKLKEVSKNAQVICVTHLAQIAAMAKTHFLIHKQVTEGRTYTNVQPLSADGRKYELARIMGGMNISELMLKNAEEMLKEFSDDNL